VIRRLLAAIGRKVVGDDPNPQPSVLDVLDGQGAPLSAAEVRAYCDDLDARTAPLSDVERVALAAGVLATRGPASTDTSPLGVHRRMARDVAQVHELQKDERGFLLAYQDLLTTAGKSGTHIPDVLASELVACLEGDAR
jgi:hypothetical protein